MASSTPYLMTPAGKSHKIPWNYHFPMVFLWFSYGFNDLYFQMFQVIPNVFPFCFPPPEALEPGWRDVAPRPSSPLWKTWKSAPAPPSAAMEGTSGWRDLWNGDDNNQPKWSKMGIHQEQLAFNFNPKKLALNQPRRGISAANMRGLCRIPLV